MKDMTIAPPTLFQVELTGYCNIDCAMCARSAGLKRPIGHMDPALFKDIVDQSARFKMPIHWLHHFGETMLYPHLREVLQYFQQHGFGRGAVSTNAIVMDAERVDILLDHASYILCCLDTMEPEAYAKIRNNRHFEKVKTNIERLVTEHERRNSQAQVVIQFLRTQHNWDEDISAMMEHFGKRSRVKFIEKRTDKHPRGADITLIRNKRDVFVSKSGCPKAQNELCILWTGEAVGCCWDADGEQIIGDVRNETIREIWQGEKHREMQRHLAAGTPGVLPLCDRCTGPIAETDFGLVEQVNAWVADWKRDGARVALAPASQGLAKLLKTSRLAEANLVGMFDAAPDAAAHRLGPTHPEELRPRPYAEVLDTRPDVLLIYSPKASSDIYFEQRHLRERGVKVVTLGGHLD
jgi:hypothetical protein